MVKASAVTLSSVVKVPEESTRSPVTLAVLAAVRSDDTSSDVPTKALFFTARPPPRLVEAAVSVAEAASVADSTVIAPFMEASLAVDTVRAPAGMLQASTMEMAVCVHACV